MQLPQINSWIFLRSALLLCSVHSNSRNRINKYRQWRIQWRIAAEILCNRVSLFLLSTYWLGLLIEETYVNNRKLQGHPQSRFFIDSHMNRCLPSLDYDKKKWNRFSWKYERRECGILKTFSILLSKSFQKWIIVRTWINEIIHDESHHKV